LRKQKTESKYLAQRDKHRKAITQTIPFKREAGLERKHTLWSLFIMALSFSISVLLLLLSSSLFARVEPVGAFFVVVVIILVGITFDMVGVAVTAAEETPFHSMASRKMRGARHSILLIRNASRVSSICNDVVGDICSVVSGTAGAAIVFRVYGRLSDTTWVEILMGAVIAALTVGGKAFGKNFGIENSNYIIFAVGRLFSFFAEVRQQKNRP
jgi:hypothetical protein